MIKAIMAVDEKGGVSKGTSMPWPRNSQDLNWFKSHTLNNIVVMGRVTWIDPFMPSPLNSRINVLITNQKSELYPGADFYIKGDLINELKNIQSNYSNKDMFIIGGPEILNQVFNLVNEFYLTRIYGNYNCEKFIDLNKIEKSMNLEKKIDCNDKCHFEIWKR